MQDREQFRSNRKDSVLALRPHEKETIKRISFALAERIHDAKPDTLVFLDRGMRPVYYAFDAAWNKKYPGIQHPPVVYLNIGTEKRSSSGEPALDDVPTEVRDEIHKSFSKSGASGKKPELMIVDDWSDTGASISMTYEKLRTAFPQANISDTTWLKSRDAFAPPWWIEKKLTGRSDALEGDNNLRSTQRKKIQPALDLANEMMEIFEEE